MNTETGPRFVYVIIELRSNSRGICVPIHTSQVFDCFVRIKTAIDTEDWVELPASDKLVPSTRIDGREVVAYYTAEIRESPTEKIAKAQEKVADAIESANGEGEEWKD